MPREFVWSELPDALHEHQPWGLPGVEPPLCEVLADPIIRALMQSDGVTSTALESIIMDTRRRRRTVRLENKIAVATGASSAIGKEIARTFAGEGAASSSLT